jgi:hypothetical protein
MSVAVGDTRTVWRAAEFGAGSDVVENSASELYRVRCVRRVEFDVVDPAVVYAEGLGCDSRPSSGPSLTFDEHIHFAREPDTATCCIARKSVDFPAPEGPLITMARPPGTPSKRFGRRNTSSQSITVAVEQPKTIRHCDSPAVTTASIRSPLTRIQSTVAPACAAGPRRVTTRFASRLGVRNSANGSARRKRSSTATRVRCCSTSGSPPVTAAEYAARQASWPGHEPDLTPGVDPVPTTGRQH